MIRIAKYLFTLLFASIFSLHAAGQWDIHLPHSSYSRMERFADACFVVADGALFSVPADRPAHTEAYSRLSGLSGTGIFDIAVTADSAFMAVVYADGNIDIIDRQLRVTNVPDFKNKIISGDRTLRSLHIEGQRLYLSASYCLLEVDLPTGLITHTVILNRTIQASFFHEGLLHICTPEGVYAASLADNLNIPSSWTPVLDLSVVAALTFTSGGEEQTFLIDSDNNVYHFSHDWRQLYQWRCTDPTILRDAGNEIFFYSYGPVLLSKDRHLFARNSSAPFTSIRDLLLTSDSTCLMLHGQEGIMEVAIGTRAQNRLDLEILDHTPLSPSVGSPTIGSMAWAGGQLIGIASLSPSHNDAAALWNTRGCISRFSPEEGLWSNVHDPEVSPLLDPAYPYFRLLNNVSVDPTDPNHLAISSYSYGAFEFYADSLLVHHTPSSSPLPDVAGLCPASAVSFDSEGNLWIACSNTDSVLSCLTPQGQWCRLSVQGFRGTSASSIRRLVEGKRDPYRFKWIISGIYRECIGAMYYDNGTPTDPSDDESVAFTALIDQDGNRYTPNVNDIVEDRDGAMWLMTASGPFVIDHPIDSYYSPGSVRRIKIPRNDGTNLADYLLPDVDCMCCIVDAANRKWIGTVGNGLYCISADGLQQLAHFTMANSPLLTDDILALAYDDASGTLFISCDGGILSYVTDAVKGEQDFSNVYCYPNPVRPDFTGSLVINGLMDGSQVAITDASGHVVYRAQSAGGSLSWDLTTHAGRRVAPGVYLVMATDAEGHEGVVSRFLVL